MGAGPHVLLGVTGGIAAYKAPELVRALVTRGATVQVVMTTAARSFVSPLALATVSGRPVRMDLLDAAEEGRVGHIELADQADIVLVAPGTANMLAKAAAGLADDLVSVCLLATRAPILWAPAMNTNMWRHPATSANLATLVARGHQFVGPDRGELACGWVGEGRMIDPGLIADRVFEITGGASSTLTWSGGPVLVSAGPTREALDPVRYVSNGSTGAMGFALARMAAARGAEVTLVAGPVVQPTPPGVRRIDVTTGADMLAAMDGELSAQGYGAVIMTAAVSDLVPSRSAALKLPKGDLLAAVQGMQWGRAVDVLQTLTTKYADRVYWVGFAAETVDDDTDDIDAVLVQRGRDKLERKGCHALFVNRVGVADTGFATATNAGLLLIAAEGGVKVHSSGSPQPKEALATWLLDRIHPHIEKMRRS